MRPAREVVRGGTLHLLGPGDRGRIAPIAAAAFGGSDFYAAVLGFPAARQGRFFDALFHLLLRDPNARVYGLEADGRLVAGTALVFAGFPCVRNALGFLRTLWRELGPLHLLRYLRFVRAYDRVMRADPKDAEREARAYWLFADPEAVNLRHGSALVRLAMADLAAEGWGLVTGFVDASNANLLAFYRRLGFSVSDSFPFLGRRGARITCRLPRAGTRPAC